MASEVKQWKAHKVRSERGYRIYQFGDTPIGLIATNPGQNKRMYSHWSLSLTTLKWQREKVYPGYFQQELGYSPGAFAQWRESYLNEALRWLNDHQSDFWRFLIDAKRSPLGISK